MKRSEQFGVNPKETSLKVRLNLVKTPLQKYVCAFHIIRSCAKVRKIFENCKYL